MYVGYMCMCVGCIYIYICICVGYIFVCKYICECIKAYIYIYICKCVCLFFVLCAIYVHKYYVFKIHNCAYNIHVFPVFRKPAGMPQAVIRNLVEHVAWWTLLPRCSHPFWWTECSVKNHRNNVFHEYSEQHGYVTSIYLLNKDLFYFKTKKKMQTNLSNKRDISEHAVLVLHD